MAVNSQITGLESQWRKEGFQCCGLSRCYSMPLINVEEKRMLAICCYGQKSRSRHMRCLQFTS